MTYLAKARRRLSKIQIFRDRGRGRVCFTRDVTTTQRFLINFLAKESFFLGVSYTQNCFLLLKNEDVNKRHLTRSFDVARVCCQNCLWKIDVNHVNQHWVYFLASCASSGFKSFPLRTEEVVAISDDLLEGSPHLINMSIRGERELKTDDFRGTLFMDGPLIKIFFDFEHGFCGSLSMLFREAPASCDKAILK